MSDPIEQLPSIPLKSPLAIIGAFLFMVRDRFKAGNGLPWTWYDDNAVTEILIEAQYNANTETPDTRPGIYIDKDQTSYGKVSTGNLDQDQPKILEKQLTHYISFGQTDIVIDCISPARGESMQLADLVQVFFESSKYQIMRVFGFRDITPIVMSRTQPFTLQKDLHQTTINFRVEYEVRWATMPAVATLRQLGVHLTEKKSPVNTTLADIYLKSVYAPPPAPPPGAPVITPLETPTNDETTVVTGTAGAGTTVDIYVDGVKIGETNAENGKFTLEFGELAEGQHTITAKARDAAGLTSSYPARPQSIVIDRTPPDVPNVALPTAGSAVTTPSVILRGTAEPNSIVEVYNGDTLIAVTTTDSQGNWSVNGTL